jgi:hypothetical protein
MITAFNHEFGAGYVGPLPMSKGPGNVLVVKPTIKESDPRWPKLKRDVDQFAKDQRIDHVVMMQAD